MTTQALTRTNGNALAPAGYEREQVDLIKKTVAPDATDLELQLFLHTCQSRGLDPLLKQVYFIKRGGKGTIQVSIDGFRTKAAETGEYAGSDDAEFEGTVAGKYPASARVTVYRLVQGHRCPFSATARWHEYVQEYNGRPSGLWEKMPHTMLAKCFSDDTEILTDRGFQRFCQVTGAVLQVTDRGLEPCSARPFSQDYYGPMITLDSDDLNFSVTPNHDMLTTVGKLEAQEMYDRSRSRSAFWIPRCVKGDSVGIDFTEKQLRLVAAYVADGSDIVGGFKIEVSRPRKVEALCDIGGYETVRKVACAGKTVSTPTRTIETKSDKTRFTYKHPTTNVLFDRGKKPVFDALALLSGKHARVLVDTLLEFDGHRAKKGGVRRFYTSRLDIIAAFELLAVKAGYAVSTRKVRTSDLSDKPNYYITVSDRDAIPVTRWGREYNGDKGGTRKHTGLELQPNASGRVWCVTVPSGVIVVRRNGFSMLCGNCAESLALRKAFPAQLGGLYTNEEMQQADGRGRTVSAIVQDENVQVDPHTGEIYAPMHEPNRTQVRRNARNSDPEPYRPEPEIDPLTQRPIVPEKRTESTGTLVDAEMCKKGLISHKGWMKKHGLDPDDRDLAIYLLNVLDERGGPNKPYWNSRKDLMGMDWQRVNRAEVGADADKVQRLVATYRESMAEQEQDDPFADEAPTALLDVPVKAGTHHGQS